ncbi:WD repeat-containing protein 4 [Coemansia sp. RSA 1722]|nr:WD repeat-containing protein 4 [Coemansia sp. RSA 1722]
MAAYPVTIVESSSQGQIAFVAESDFTVSDAAGNVIASTIDAACSNDAVANVEGPESKEAIRAACFSRNGALFAICTNDKAIRIYETAGWSLKRKLASEKRTNALCFDPEGEYLITGDKFGDCYRISVDNSADKPEILLGHVSILCSVGFSYGPNPYVLTCDRDEKLRVSKYPNAYNIQAFGLGHREFVTSVATASFAPEIAVTGSGDGTIRLWKLDSGELLQTVELDSLMRKYYESGKAKCGENTREDRTAATQRYGVLRVRSSQSLRSFVAVVERIPAALVLPIGEDLVSFEEPVLVDTEAVPTDIAAIDDGFVVSFEPRTAETQEGPAVAAYKKHETGFAVDDSLTRTLADNVAMPQAEKEVHVPSIFVWGNKQFLERPQGDEEEQEE